MIKMKFVVLFFLLVFAATAQAVTTAVGNGADTFLSNDSQTGHLPDATHGSSTGIQIRTAWGVRMKLAYVRFDISGISLGPDAILGLNASYSNRTRTLGIYGLADGLDNWDEATICYNNAPGIVPNPPTPLGEYAIDANLTRLADIDLVQGQHGWYYSDPNSLMDAFIAADTDNLLTFAIIYETTSSDTNPDWSFRSKEYATSDAPVLIPEPATIALLGLGGLALLRKRRR